MLAGIEISNKSKYQGSLLIHHEIDMHFHQITSIIISIATGQTKLQHVTEPGRFADVNIRNNWKDEGGWREN